jgi:hypothetical protein
MKQAIWDRFCSRFNVFDLAVPLFATDTEGHVQSKTIGKDGRLVLKRHEQCDRFILGVTDQLVHDWQEKEHQFDGMLYLMGWKKEGQFIPLYIGKTESLGKGDRNLSVNIKSLHTDKTKFARWGDGYSYHVGDLSACVLPGHDESKKTLKYQSWAECLFDTGTHLRHPVYFWAVAWKSDETGVWDEYGSTSLALLEYLLIGVAGGLSNCLLNREGIARARGIQRHST